MSSRRRERRFRPDPNRILSGIGEAIFDSLPERVLENLRYPASENALVWNLTYPLAQPRVSFTRLLALRPLWGTPALDHLEDEMVPYFWGYNLDGGRLPRLDETLIQVDGPGHQTEVDLLLMGERNLVLVECKHMSGLGRCGRFARGRCPEVHGEGRELEPCRYWHRPEARFETHLDFGPQPCKASGSPPCNRHYQLARTLLVGIHLAAGLDRLLHLWLITPRKRWRSLERGWLDFCERLRDDDLWRRLRVLAWEDIATLTSG